MRLIDADELETHEQLEPLGNGKYEYVEVVYKDDIDAMPTIETPKRGYWVKVSGYVTPGGDSVWCCSECGKGTHVYGVEHGTYGNDVSDSQWVACPNCGTLMI